MTVNTNTVAIPGAPTHKELLQMIKSFGPIGKVIADEKYLPTSVETFVKKCHLLDDQNKVCCSNVTSESLPKGAESKPLFLKLKDPSDFIGDSSAAKSYVKAEIVNNQYTDLHFLIFFAFRSPVTAKITNVTASKRPISIPLLSETEGHWEQVTLRFDNTDKEHPHSVCTRQSGRCSWTSFSDCHTNGKQLVLNYSSGMGVSLGPKGDGYTSKTYKNIINDDIRVDLSSGTSSKLRMTLDCSVAYELLSAPFLRENELTVPNWAAFEGEYGRDDNGCVEAPKDIQHAIQKYANPWPEILPRIVHPYDGPIENIKGMLRFDRVTFKSLSEELYSLIEE